MAGEYGARRTPLATALWLGLAFSAGQANAQTRKVVDVSVGARAATSPFLMSGDNESAAVTASVDPSISFEGESTTIQVAGHARLDQYLDNYGTDAAFRLGANARSLLNERTTLSGSVDVSSSRSGVQDLVQTVRPGASPVPEQGFPDILVPDITGAGLGNRINGYSARAALDHVVSPTDTIGFGVDGSFTDASGPLGDDYSTIGLQVNYGRRLTERTMLRATLQATSFDYTGEADGGGSTLSPLVGFEYSFSETASISAQAGVSLTRISGPLETTDEHVSFALDVSACDRQVRSSICAAASRSTQPTAFGGVSTVSALTAVYDLRTGLNDSLSFSGRYGRTNSILAISELEEDESEILAASASYSRELSPRLFAYVTPGVSRINSSNRADAEMNFQIELGIRHRFGDRQ